MELHDYNNHYNMSLVMIVIMLVSFSSLNITEYGHGNRMPRKCIP